MFDKIFNEMVNVTELKFDVAGLIPAIVQDADTRVVLMQGYMNRESLAETERSGKVCFFSRSRQRLWTKGEESGHFLLVKEILADCDRDSLLVKVTPWDRLATRDKIRAGEKRTWIRIFCFTCNGIWKNEKMSLRKYPIRLA